MSKGPETLVPVGFLASYSRSNPPFCFISLVLFLCWGHSVKCNLSLFVFLSWCSPFLFYVLKGHDNIRGNWILEIRDIFLILFSLLTLLTVLNWPIQWWEVSTFLGQRRNDITFRTENSVQQFQHCIWFRSHTYPTCHIQLGENEVVALLHCTIANT